VAIHRLGAALLLLGGSLAPQQPEPIEVSKRCDKSGFHLFSPAPREWVREMDSDRPDSTLGAYTVDADHFQIESSMAATAHWR